jgi:hypothetical protein
MGALLLGEFQLAHVFFAAAFAQRVLTVSLTTLNAILAPLLVIYILAIATLLPLRQASGAFPLPLYLLVHILSRPLGGCAVHLARS